MTICETRECPRVQEVVQKKLINSTMSFFSKVFGGKKEPAAPTTTEAIQKLRETEEMLVKKQDFLEGKIEQEIVTAKKNGTKNKRAAIQALKRKKRYEKQLQQIDGTLSTIEMQREALESANTNTTVLQTMKNAADALKAAHLHMDVDQVHDMMDDIAEQQDVAKEISDAISNPVAFGHDVDEDELEKELEELEQEALDEELLGVEGTAELPAVPASTEPVAPPKKTKAKAVEEDDDLKQLEAWAS
ncbi:charged multivesicular body protein 4b [Fopius arisanus]|uniref:Charged multivesicular body protein 4b n=3 Tax=Braconidae TaxID=7402 RepID=A0A9R1T2K3_9HYME|nr:PREDICTED: charged multivesicular body protein 4b [Fopius arisanus]